MKRYNDLVADCLPHVTELFPWDLEERLDEEGRNPLLLDVREPYEFNTLHIPGSINVPRGVLETACEWDFEETVPALAGGRESEIVVICRSGNRSVMAAFVMQLMGFKHVASLKTGVKGWNDYEGALQDGEGNAVDIDDADAYFAKGIREDQKNPDDR